MKISFTKKMIGPVLLAAVFVFSPPSVQMAKADLGPNLIANPDLELMASTTPAHWQLGGYSDTFTGTYPVAGPAGATDKAVQITISSHVAGDAKWIFESVPVEEGALYSFSDDYKSDVTTTVVAAFTAASSSDPTLFTNLISLSATGGQWKSTTQTLTIPFGYTKVSVYHVIAAVGTLATDNYSLNLVASASDVIFPEGMVSLTLDDGWSTSYDTALPMLRDAGLKATFYIITQDMQDANTTTADNLLATATHTDVQRTDTPGASQWANVYTDPFNQTYRYTVIYTADQPSTVEASYSLSGTTTTQTIGTLPAATNRTATLVFSLPVNPTNTVTPITLTQRTAGTLSITGNPSLTGYDLYMNSAQVLDSQAAGIEIGNHTVNHCNLVTGLCPDAAIPNRPDLLTAAQEVGNAFNTLQGIGATVNSLAYPYGAFDTTTQQIVKDIGLEAARSVNAGFNTKYSDKYGLNVQIVDSTTPLSRVQEWIDSALANKLWLVLVFHQVESQPIIDARGDIDAVTPDTFQGVINYLKAKNAPIKTLSEGVGLMDNITPPNPKVSLTALTQVIDDAQARLDAAVEGDVPGNYATGSKAILRLAINGARLVTENDTQATVDAALASLNSAIASFEAAKIGPSNVSALTALISSAQSQYDSAVEGSAPGNYATGSKAIFLNAINAAKAVTAAQSQSAVDSAVTVLTAAIATFDSAKVGPSDLSTLSARIAEAQALYDAAEEGNKIGNYASGSKAIFLAAIDAAKALTVNDTQERIGLSLATLNTAISAFESSKVTLRLSKEKGAYATTDSANLTWTTSHPATSRILWDTVSHATADSLKVGQPNYGYANSTKEDTTMTLNHAVIVSGLAPDTTYYFRSVSHGSPETIGEEVTLKTAQIVYGGYVPPATGSGVPAPMNNSPEPKKEPVSIAAAKPLAVTADAYIPAEADSVYNFAGTLRLGTGQMAVYNKLIDNNSLTDKDKNAIADFIQTGTASTLHLGYGERAGTLSSFRRAFGHLPQSIGDWEDVIRIANGRWPRQTDLDTENASLTIFRFIYKRAPLLSNVHDASAVNIISYGLRPRIRNLASERAAMRTFRALYGYNPSAAKDWDIVRAVAYSGARR